MSDVESDNNNVLTARISVAGGGVACALAALGGYFVNVGITLGCGLAALVLFLFAHNFSMLERFQLSPPYFSRPERRAPWQVFWISTYVGIIVAVIASIIIGQAFYIHELKDTISRQTTRALTSDQKNRLKQSLHLDVGEHYSFQINSIPNCDECEQFAEELREFLSTIPGWSVGGGALSFGRLPWHQGMWIVSRADEKDSVPVKKIKEAFRDAGLPLNADSEESQPGVFVIVIARQK